MNPQAARNYFTNLLPGNDIRKEYLASLFESILQANQNLVGIQIVTAAQIEATAQETTQYLDIQYDLDVFDALAEQQVIIF